MNNEFMWFFPISWGIIFKLFLLWQYLIHIVSTLTDYLSCVLFTLVDLPCLRTTKNHGQKKLGEQNNYFILYFHITEGSQGRNLKAGRKAVAMEEHCLLACFSWLVALLSYITQHYQPRLATMQPSWAFPYQLLFKKIGQSHGGIFSIKNTYS